MQIYVNNLVIFCKLKNTLSFDYNQSLVICPLQISHLTCKFVSLKMQSWKFLLMTL